MPTNLRDALVDEIRDLYDAEKQIVKALPKMVKGAVSDDLREAFESHLEETQGQVTRLERVFELLDEKPRGKHCAGMAGILEEGAEALEQDGDDAVMDACLIAGAQRVEHYEMSSYGTAIAWSEALELPEIAEILSQSLAEERAADEKLSALAESGINDAASVAMTDADDDEMGDDTEQAVSAPAKPSRSQTAGSARSARTRGGRR